ncbi:hypothetical protein SCWH03_29940 [Streptomyces pacificus]|uniref:Uncharacterized protein n=1 Tax=Streptomyces pacificus TaxID=2705029 RepID=A0A6A0AWN3_9ACTN|nr:hypothetical protein SCWH03_29940 [Streptomyces pacificus]
MGGAYMGCPSAPRASDTSTGGAQPRQEPVREGETGAYGASPRGVAPYRARRLLLPAAARLRPAPGRRPG